MADVISSWSDLKLIAEAEDGKWTLSILLCRNNNGVPGNRDYSQRGTEGGGKGNYQDVITGDGSLRNEMRAGAGIAFWR